MREESGVQYYKCRKGQYSQNYVLDYILLEYLWWSVTNYFPEQANFFG